MNLPKKFRYELSNGAIFTFLIIFGGLASWLGWEAMHVRRDAEQVLLGMVSLSSAGIEIRYWLVVGMYAIGAVFAGRIALLAALAAIRLVRKLERLELTEDGIVVPQGFLMGKMVAVRYADIKGVWQDNFRAGPCLQIKTALRRASISSQFMENADSFRELRDFLYERAPTVKVMEVKNGKAGITRVEFLARQALVERQITRGILPAWIVYPAMLILVPAILFVGALLILALIGNYPPAVKSDLVLHAAVAFGFCAVGLSGCWWTERAWKRRFKRYELNCKGCGKSLLFSRGRQAAKAGRCGTCGERVLD